MAGWISLCELARGANDKAFAGAALDQALVALNQLAPDPARCEYVPGIEREVRAVRGEAPAAALLRSAADWAMDLPEQTRRNAYVVFAEELFVCNDYEGSLARAPAREGRGMAKRHVDGDVGRGAAEGVAAAANMSNFRDTGVTFAMSAERPSSSSPAPSPSAGFFKSLDFKSNYYKP